MGLIKRCAPSKPCLCILPDAKDYHKSGKAAFRCKDCSAIYIVQWKVVRMKFGLRRRVYTWHEVKPPKSKSPVRKKK